MKRVVISEFMDETAVQDLSRDHGVLYDPALVDDPDRLMAEIATADAIIVRNRTQVRGALLEAGKSLAAVGRLGVGLDNIDLEACAARQISVHPASGANDQSVAEYVLTTAANLRRRSYAGLEAMLAGDWPRPAMGKGGEMGGKILGLVGMGSIARETAARARGLAMVIHGFDPFVPADDPIWASVHHHAALDTLLSEADVISLHVPLTRVTRHLIDANALSAMKDDAILINAARGGVVDETALANALRDNKIGGAALDVFETEPLTAEAAEKFRNLSNLILTPHIAGVTAEANIRVSAVTVDNIRNALA